jgi:hypothetical protein
MPRRTTVGTVRSSLYGAARLLGDYQATRTGHVGRRVERRLVGRSLGRLMTRYLR